MAIKKAFQPIVELLEANSNRKVESILDQVRELAEAKGAGGSATTVHRDENGEVVAIKDYYFGQWLPVKFVEFGKKAGSASGFNTMCKEGNSKWSKQQRDFKKGKEALLQRVADGEVAADQISAELEKLEAERTRVVPKEDGIAFDNLEELLNTSDEELQRMADNYQAKLDTEQREAEEAAEQTESADSE